MDELYIVIRQTHSNLQHTLKTMKPRKQASSSNHYIYFSARPRLYRMRRGLKWFQRQYREKTAQILDT